MVSKVWWVTWEFVLARPFTLLSRERNLQPCIKWWGGGGFSANIAKIDKLVRRLHSAAQPLPSASLRRQPPISAQSLQTIPKQKNKKKNILLCLSRSLELRDRSVPRPIQLSGRAWSRRSAHKVTGLLVLVSPTIPKSSRI